MSDLDRLIAAKKHRDNSKHGNCKRFRMAGKKGATQARSKTQAERDQYALTKIEELLDKAIEGKQIEGWNPIRLRALEIRYSKLRASLASTELSDKRAAWTDVLNKLNDLRSSKQEQAVEAQPEEAPQEQPAAALH